MVPTHCLSKFMWSADSRVLHTEASMLAHVTESPFGAFDAERSGFHIKSHHTGQVLTYVIVHVERDRDQDILEWVLACDESDIRVVVYND